MFILNAVNRTEFESLKETMQMYQNNIDNNITWFYTALGIIVGVLLVGLYFLIKTSVSAGIQNGIDNAHKKIEKQLDERRDFLYASGSTSVSIEHGNLMQFYGFKDLSIYNFVSLTIISKTGRVMEYHSLDIKDKNDFRGFDVKLVDYNVQRDGFSLQCNIVWRNDTSYEDLIKKQKEEKIMV